MRNVFYVSIKTELKYYEVTTKLPNVAQKKQLYLPHNFCSSLQKTMEPCQDVTRLCNQGKTMEKLWKFAEI